MKLQRELDAIRARLDATVDRRILAKLDRGVAQLRASGLAERALRTGDVAPDFQLPDQHGRQVRLGDRLATGPLVLVFMRGEWCPYCTATMRAWQTMHTLVAEMGAAFIMVSPQSCAQSAATTRRYGLTYPILSDHWSAVAEAFGIAYEIAGDYRDFVQGEFGLDVGEYNGTHNWRVPISATFVIDADRRIALAHVEPDHRVRLEPEETLVALARLRLRSLH